MSGFIYAIGDGQGAVKIGYAVRPQRRLHNLQIGSRSVLSLLGVRAGTRLDEKQLHVEIADARIRGEWFRLTDAVQAILSSFATADIVRRNRRDASPNLAVTAIVDRIGVSALAQALGHKNPSTVHSWKTRGRIPSGNWDGIMRVAREKKIGGIDLNTLAIANGIGEVIA